MTQNTSNETNTDLTDVMRRYTQAITTMLLLDKPMKEGVAIMAGKPLDLDGKAWLGGVAAETGNDVVHLEFAPGKDGAFYLSSINVVLPRETMCWVVTDCRLWWPRTRNGALILPQPQSRGHFRLSPDELIHIDGKPADVEGGMRRADKRLRDLAARGEMKPEQVKITEMSVRA